MRLINVQRQKGAINDLFMYNYKEVPLTICSDILFFLKHSTINKKS